MSVESRPWTVALPLRSHVLELDCTDRRNVRESGTVHRAWLDPRSATIEKIAAARAASRKTSRKAVVNREDHRARKMRRSRTLSCTAFGIENWALVGNRVLPVTIHLKRLFVPVVYSSCYCSRALRSYLTATLDISIKVLALPDTFCFVFDFLLSPSGIIGSSRNPPQI